MQIHLKHPGQPVADFSIAAAVAIVAGITVDCAGRQQDSSVIVEIRQTSTGPAESTDGAYLAQIEIPARQYIEVPNETEGEAPVREAIALDPHAISITLWPAV